MEKMYFAQKAFILDGGKLLLVQKAPGDPDNPGRWEVPGGRMDFGEDVDEHIMREVKEEVGLSIKPGRPFYIWQWQLKRKQGGATSADLSIQIVAVARLCEAVTKELDFSNRVSEDFLGEVHWVRLGEVMSYDLIPNMIPVVEAFMQQEEVRRSGASV